MRPKTWIVEVRDAKYGPFQTAEKAATWAQENLSDPYAARISQLREPFDEKLLYGNR